MIYESYHLHYKVGFMHKEIIAYIYLERSPACNSQHEEKIEIFGQDLHIMNQIVW